MDALGAFLQLNGLAGGGNSHPVSAPDFVIAYEQKNITADIKPYLLSISYTDYLGGMSDELQIDIEDVRRPLARCLVSRAGRQPELGVGRTNSRA